MRMLYWILLAWILHFSAGFKLGGYPDVLISRWSTKSHGNNQRKVSLNMIFDFLRERAEEGIAQVKNIATKTMEGKLGEALEDSVKYIRTRQQIDEETLRKTFSGLAKTRDAILRGISGAFEEENLALEERLSRLEETLLQADIGSTLSGTIIDDLRNYAKQENLEVTDIVPVVRERLIEVLTNVNPSNNTYSVFDRRVLEKKSPAVMFVIGANGMGKTTSIGKMAARFKNEGELKVLLGACDTYRAAAVEQLVTWSQRANVSIEVPTEEERTANNAVGVVSRTLKRAIDESYDIVLLDTAGRLSNNFELVDQLQKMKQAIQSIMPDAPHETVLVVDGGVGRNAVEQTKSWRKYVGVDSLIVTKLDGTARGGFIVSIAKDMNIPIKFIGVGEKIEDLRDFRPDVYVDALLGTNEQDVNKLKQRAQKIFGITKRVTTPTNPAKSPLEQIKKLDEVMSKPQERMSESTPSNKKRKKVKRQRN